MENTNFLHSDKWQWKWKWKICSKWHPLNRTHVTQSLSNNSLAFCVINSIPCILIYFLFLFFTNFQKFIKNQKYWKQKIQFSSISLLLSFIKQFIPITSGVRLSIYNINSLEFEPTSLLINWLWETMWKVRVPLKHSINLFPNRKIQRWNCSKEELFVNSSKSFQ